MLYKIDNDYYILVGNKYVKVAFEIKNGDVDLTSNKDDYIERNINVVAKEQPFDEKFKEFLINEKSRSNSNEMKPNKSKFSL